MRILFAGGGTAGHINPALAVAGYIRDNYPDTKILFVGNENGMEQRLVNQAGFEIKSIVINGLKRSMSPKAIAQNIKTVFRAQKAVSLSKKIIKEFAPDICVGTGGYVSGPVLKAAQSLKIPTVIHEQNAFPGVTTKMLSKKADAVMLAIEDAKKYLNENCNFVLTGNPIRTEILLADKEQARKKLGLDNRPVVLSFGGSLGARKINENVAQLIARSGKDGKYNHIHAYGQYGKWFPDMLLQKGCDINKCPNLDIREYINDMPVCLAAADVVICRAGAISLCEIEAKGKPSILIPSPNVAENHQYYNAMALVNKKAALVIEEKDLTPQKIIEAVDMLLSDKKVLEQYGKNAESMAITDANERIYNVIRQTLQKRK